MSGVTGDSKIKGREVYTNIIESYKEIINNFPGFISMKLSGSYNSNKNKVEFGDIDLILTVNGSLYNNDKKIIKKELAKYLTSFPEDVILPFKSKKYKGRRYYNSGEIITVSYKSNNISCQIDNIIALNEAEANFKQKFLDMPAEKQGLILGLIKTILLEKPLYRTLKKLNINVPLKLKSNEEYEFNCSSKELQLRKITFEENTFKQKKKEILWTSNNWEDVEYLLSIYDINTNFKTLAKKIKRIIKNPRSSKRIVGIFNSMVTVKNGEIGTEKGRRKEESIDFINELFEDRIGILVGRFQPVTKAHTNIIKQMEKDNVKNIIFIVKGKLTSKNKEDNPFDLDLQQKMLNLVKNNNTQIIEINTGFIPDALNSRDEKKFTLYTGTDRKLDYERMCKYLNKDISLYIKEIKRNSEDISATKIREALSKNNKKIFENLTPEAIHSLYEELKLFVV